MRLIFLSPVVVALSCSSSWRPSDADGDGFTPLDGDCWDNPIGPGVGDLTGADIRPGASETWYDGFDQDCGGEDDYDQDGDGWVPAEYQGMPTLFLEDSGQLPAGDCWDDPALLPEDQRVVSSSLTDREGNSLYWNQPIAADVHPTADETWYDGADQDCGADDDFDQDGDGFATDAYPNRAGVYGDDCIDGNDLDADNPAGVAADDVHPEADETWYDGTDQNCDENDCDQDGDGWDYDGLGEGWCETEECNDLDAEEFPDPDVEEIWYNGNDENCDGNDGDQDGDGYWHEDYELLVEQSGGEPLEVPDGSEGDCDDENEDINPGEAETWYDGVDADCGGEDDFDQDGDGYRHQDYVEKKEVGDCDDEAVDVNPEATEIWYDGVDQDCSGTSDYDADLDGFDSEDYAGDDCDDNDAAVNPDAAETWYDGVDGDCDDASDYDQDGDGEDHEDHGGADCDDEDSAINSSASETWYDGVDGDCDGASDYDQDGDGEDHEDYGGVDCDDEDSSVNSTATDTWYDGVDSDCDGASDYDQDGDGEDHDDYGGADCDDEDGAINSSATEIWYDGVDQDCSGTSDYDQDGDGADSEDYGGDDCLDSDANIAPGLTDDATDSLTDNDCDDLVDEDAIVEGSLLFTELSRMSSAGGTATHSWNLEANWVEVYNAESFDIDISNWALRACEEKGTNDGTGDGGWTEVDGVPVPDWDQCDEIHWVGISPDAAVIVPAGGYAVLCQNDDGSIWDDPTQCDYVYTDSSAWTGSSPEGYAYANEDTYWHHHNGLLALELDGTQVDELGWYELSTVDGPWPRSVRYTMTLSLSAYTASDNDSADNWCNSDNSLIWASSPTDNFGSPLAADKSCP